MALPNVGDTLRMIIQIILYFVIILFGFLASVPVGMTKSDNEGECLMYPKHTAGTVISGPKSNCNYVITIHVLFSILFAAAMTGLYIYAVIMKQRQQNFEIIDNFIIAVVILVVNAFALFLCFVAACLISVGFKKFCNALKDATGLDDCDVYEVFGDNYHKNYTLATTACWLATLCWLVQTGISAFLLWRKVRSGEGLGSVTSGTTATTTATTTVQKTSISVVEKY